MGLNLNSNIPFALTERLETNIESEAESEPEHEQNRRIMFFYAICKFCFFDKYHVAKYHHFTQYHITNIFAYNNHDVFMFEVSELRKFVVELLVLMSYQTAGWLSRVCCGAADIFIHIDR